MLYPIAIIQQDGQFHGRLPDLPDIEVTGDTMANTIEQARTQVIAHLQDLAENDDPLPQGSDVATHLTSGNYAGWTWAIVSIGASRIVGEEVTVSVDFPERLLKKVMAHLKDKDMTVENFIVKLLKEAIQSDK